MLTGMETLDQLTPIAERAMALYKDGDSEAARQAGEEFWAQVPHPPATDGERLASQLSLQIARRAAPVAPSEATVWLERAREAYGQASVGGQALCDFTAGMIACHESRFDEARAFFERAVAVTGPNAFSGSDPAYKAFYDETPAPAPGAVSVEELAEQGEVACDAGRYTEAVQLWQRALAGTEPSDAETLFWLHASICDAQFQLGQFQATYDSAQQALQTGDVGNPFVWLRIGQAAFELGDSAKATEALISAYMLDGDEIFEDEDPKYRAWLVEQGLIQ